MMGVLEKQRNERFYLLRVPERQPGQDMPARLGADKQNVEREIAGSPIGEG